MGKVSSSLVSVKTRISICCITISFNCSNLFESEFIIRFPIIIFFGFLILSFLISNNRFGEVSLMDLLLAWLTKFITSFSLERSQEDMLKFIVEESVS